jgi:hypothetical protein
MGSAKQLQSNLEHSNAAFIENSKNKTMRTNVPEKKKLILN